MSLEATCHQCGQRFQAAPKWDGLPVACPRCGAPWRGSAPAPAQASGGGGRVAVIILSIFGIGALVGLVVVIAVGSWIFHRIQAVNDRQSVAVPFDSKVSDPVQSFRESRRGFQSQLTSRESAGVPVPNPPPEIAQVVMYPSPAGNLKAYLTHGTGGERKPAMVWISGGDCNTIDDGFFRVAPRENDQTASAFRKAGIIMMYPSLRGGNDNPGVKEAMLGEVDDVLAAADFLAQQPNVDPRRIYLGGHSTGGTLVLLVAAASDKFRATFSFGPAESVAGYGRPFMPFNRTRHMELELREPIRWLNDVTRPLFMFEGRNEPGNRTSLIALKKSTSNPYVNGYIVRDTDHFSILAPLTQLVAQKILADTGESTNIAFSDVEFEQYVSGRIPAPTPPPQAGTSSAPSAATVDLLAAIGPHPDPKSMSGRWTVANNVLLSHQEDPTAHLFVPQELPRAYSVSADVKVDGGDGSFNLTVLVDGHPVMVVLDGWGKQLSGLNLVGGKTGDANATTYAGQVLQPGQYNRVVVTVQPRQVSVDVNDHAIIRWTGDPAELSVDRRFWPETRDRMFLASWRTSYQVSRLTITPLKE